MEIPTAHLADWSALTDLDFALAHKVLEDPIVARFHAARPAGRQLILDNSMHELGHPLPVKDLARAADLCNADYVIAPDQLGQTQRNLDWYNETVDELAGHHHIGVVLCGKTSSERLRYLQTVSEGDMLCLPFRENRLLWWAEIERLGAWSMPVLSRIHLLGVNELAELHIFQRMTQPSILWSVDTSKPIKWAIENRFIGDGLSIRGARTTSHALLDAVLPDAQVSLMIRNLHHLRSYLA